MNFQERESYQKSLKYYRDMHNVIDTAQEKGWVKGLEKGREEGLEKGREEKTLEMIEKMLKAGMDIQTIADITSLSLDKVKAIINKW